MCHWKTAARTPFPLVALGPATEEGQETDVLSQGKKPKVFTSISHVPFLEKLVKSGQKGERGGGGTQKEEEERREGRRYRQAKMFDHSCFLAQKYGPHMLRSDALVT